MTRPAQLGAGVLSPVGGGGGHPRKR
jgi:hypothetical protein